jgi:hypothetical protein
MSHDAFNQTPGWRSIIVVPISSPHRKEGEETYRYLSLRRNGRLPKATLRCHQVTTLDRAKLTKAKQPACKSLREIEGIRAAMDLD